MMVRDSAASLLSGAGDMAPTMIADTNGLLLVRRGHHRHPKRPKRPKLLLKGE
jgi:hypothetical protein